MTEIAASMAAAGLPDGFHLAAAEIFRRSPRGLRTAGRGPRPSTSWGWLIEALPITEVARHGAPAGYEPRRR